MAADCNVAAPGSRPEVTTAGLEQQHANLEQLADEIAARSAHTTRKTQASQKRSESKRRNLSTQ
jgi:hypothetical protein